MYYKQVIYIFALLEKKKKWVGVGKSDQSPAFFSWGSKLLDGLNEGNNESEAGIGKRKSKNPRERSGTNSWARNGLSD